MKPNTIGDILLRLVICEPTTLETGCWEYPVLNDKGRGHVSVECKKKYVHILVYEHFVGPVPEGLELHHLCENKACANYEHLVPVTDKEHRALHPDDLSTHCPHGHEFTPENTHQTKIQRHCRECSRTATRAYYRRNIEKMAEKRRHRR